MLRIKGIEILSIKPQNQALRTVLRSRWSPQGTKADLHVKLALVLANIDVHERGKRESTVSYVVYRVVHGTLKVGVTPSLGRVKERDLEVGLGLR